MDPKPLEETVNRQVEEHPGDFGAGEDEPLGFKPSVIRETQKCNMSYLLYPKSMLLLAIPAHSLKQVGTVMTEPTNAMV